MLFISPPFGNYLNFKNTISIKGSYTLYPRKGLVNQILKTLRYDFSEKAWVNKIGLRNPGIDYALKNYKKDTIISVAILEESEIDKLNQKIPKDVNIELNVSCPNVNCKEKEIINNNLFKFLSKERQWCIVKLSPLVEKELIDNYYQQGFRQFHCSNTVPLGDGRGGLSGQKIMQFNKEIIPYIRQKYPESIIIAGGGIRTVKDIEYYKNLGADHFSCSTVFFNPFLAFKLYGNTIMRY